MGFLLQRLLRNLGLLPSERHTFALETDLAEYVHALAEYDERPSEEVIAELVRSGLNQRQVEQETWQLWFSLSRREQQVAALACLHFTYDQIAVRLGISPNTVKTHVRNILNKFNLHKMDEMRLMMEGWDFSAWNR